MSRKKKISLRYWIVGLVALAIVASAGILYRTDSLATDAIVEFAGVSLRIDYATTTAARERGLSGRTSIPSDYGMLFVFQQDGLYGIWMKNTLIPLDIFWLDAQGRVVSSASDVAPASYPDVFYPSEPARYVLETLAGFGRAHGVATGTPLRLKNPSIVSE